MFMLYEIVLFAYALASHRYGYMVVAPASLVLGQVVRTYYRIYCDRDDLDSFAATVRARAQQGHALATHADDILAAASVRGGSAAADVYSAISGVMMLPTRRR